MLKKGDGNMISLLIFGFVIALILTTGCIGLLLLFRAVNIAFDSWMIGENFQAFLYICQQLLIITITITTILSIGFIAETILGF